MNTSLNLQKGDSIIIWFTATDAAGREAVGVGTNQANPFETVVRWIAYEPEIAEIVANPYRPEIGDIITIQCTVTNIGVMDGMSNLTLFGENNRSFETVNISLKSGASSVHKFEIEAWKTGDLGLFIQIDGDENVIIPISNIKQRSDDSAASQSTILSLAVLSVFVSALILIIAYIRRNQYHEYDEEE